MIDLHIHSKYSPDGSEQVVDILKMAEELKLKCISITDHNTCLAYNDLDNSKVRNSFSGNIISGVELNTKVLGIPIEVLGYNIEPLKMQKLIDANYLSNIERNKYEVKKLYEICIKNNIILPNDFIENYDGTYYGSKYLHTYITKNEKNKKLISEASWNDSNVFYREYMSNPDTMFFVDVNEILPDFEKVTKIVHEAGGLLFLPHVFEYRENSERILKHILENYEIDGIECYYRNFSNEQTNYLLDICKRNSLYISGGSDFHGKGKPYIKMGIGEGDLEVPNEIVDCWKK